MKRFFSSKKNPFNLLGPGFVTGAADDDPSGITTYSQAGAQFGLQLIWLAPFTFPLMAVIQEMCARIGLVTGRGLASNIRKVFPSSIVFLLTSLLLIANTINIGADIGAMVASISLLVPNANVVFLLLLVTLLSLALQVFLPYHVYAKYLKWLAFVLIFYVFAALATTIDWGEVMHFAFLPHISFTPQFFLILTAILGTTISPYLFFWQTSQEVEEQIDAGKNTLALRKITLTPRSLSAMRADVWVGMFFSNLIMFFIILATSVTLFKSNITDIKTAADAANALRPFVGDAAYFIFTIGIIGTGLLAIPVLAGSSAYAVSESLKKNEGLSKKWYEAKVFYMVIVASMIIGLGINFLGINPMSALVWSAVVNGAVAPFILVAIILISQSKKIMGKHKNNLVTTTVGWFVVAVMFISAVGTLISLFV
ncbi:divalent metal cation transporter [Candidatus Woesebacteria bacterium]|jgi:NRAMP (natural resistance-associated macrophage protein)-like metal ion transporter|nr:divalent metal cation transporter [Candidatus Woesebacteria bacterium]MBP9687368.1 divalent metal cation transporter [Candidatus Woesebacteria bacterium]